LIDYVRVYEKVVNELPVVSITSPSSGATLPAGAVTISASASDSDGVVTRVEFYNGAEFLGEDSTAPYSFVWSSVPDGCYRIMARAIDDLGGTSTDTVDIAVGTGCPQEPFRGSAFVLPTRIEAEDFDEGGEGVAYHDLDATNNGAQYRPTEGVDIESCGDAGGGYNVGWLDPEEWIEYTVSVPVGGEYSFEARVAAVLAGGSFRLEFDGSDATGEVSVPGTGGWQRWETTSFSADLSAGTQIMRFVPTAGEFNVNYFEVVAIPTDTASVTPTAVLSLHEPFPNPFNPGSTIRYDLYVPADVDLVVYDAQGRRVRTLVASEPTAAGPHRVLWNGRDDGGRMVAGGVYFCRIVAGGQSDSVRMVLLK
jgi:hypothetical protein